MNSSQFGHNLSPEFVNRYRILLTLIFNGYYSYKELKSRSGLSQRQIEYSIKTLIRNDLLEDSTPKSNKNKVYKITESAKSFLAGVRTNDDLHKKTMNENVRARCEIHDSKRLTDLLSHSLYSFKKNEKWKNSSQYFGKINNHGIIINIGKESASLTMIAPKYYEQSGIMLGHKVIQGMLETCYVLNEKWSLGLSAPKLTSGEYVVYSPYAQAMMRKTIGKQVKGKHSLINQSAPLLIPHHEFKDPLDVDKMLQTPYDIEKIKSSMEKLTEEIDVIKQESSNNSYNFDSMNQVVGSMSEAMTKIVETVKNQSDKLNSMSGSVATIAEKMTELMNLVNPTNQQNSSQKVTNVDVNRMFG